MHDLLPLIAGLGIGIPLGAYLELTGFGTGLLCMGFYAAITYFGS